MRQPSPENNLSIASRLFYLWILPLIKKGNKKALEDSDLWELPTVDQCRTVLSRYKTIATSSSLYINFIKLSWKPLLFQIISGTVNTWLTFTDSFFLYKIVSFLKTPDDSIFGVYKYIAALFLCGCLKAVNDAQMLFIGRRNGVQFRTVLINLVYRKALTREISSGNTGLGKIVTLMSVDIEQIRSFISSLHDNFVRLPLAIIISFSSLVLLMGISAFAGAITLIFLIPLTGVLSRIANRLQKRLLEATDNRINKTNEALQAIRIIKYFAWESSFIDRISKLRAKELSIYFQIWIIWIAISLLSSGSGMIVSAVTFTVYTVYQNKTLDAATAFTALSLLRRFSDELSRLPEEISSILQIKVSISRIFAFLNEPDISVIDKLEYRDAPIIGFRNGQFSYSKTSFNLITGNIDFPLNKLTAIIGSTGSGKTTLLLALLGEIKTTHGAAFIPDLKSSQVAYCPQTAWLMNSTARDNILFMSEYNQERYRAVIEACALEKDLETLTAGDMTEIGEKGVNVSGGQKLRISLARAAYSDAQFVLLDDPFSAVDAPTAKHLLNNCICSPLFEGRTVILVTHAIGLVLPAAEHVILLQDGKINYSGKPANLKGVEIQLGLGDANSESKSIETESETTQNNDLLKALGTDLELSFKGKLVEKEFKQTGSVRSDVYRSYFTAAGGLLYFIFYMLTFIAIVSSEALFNWWIKKWTESPSQSNVFYYIKYYILFGVLILLSTNVNLICQISGAINAAKRLHLNLITRVLGAPMRFFEITPLGRLLNRFSKDISGIDSYVMKCLNSFLSSAFQIASEIVMISLVAPIFLLFVCPIASIYYIIARSYLACVRELKRLESLARSPIYAQFSESLAGCTVIRAFGLEKAFLNTCNNKVDDNHRIYFHMWVISRWFSLYSGFISSTFVLIASCAILFMNVDAGWAGIVLSYSFEFTVNLRRIVTSHANLEMEMNGVERVLEYTSIDQEDASIIESNRTPENWPFKGVVKVKNLSLRYNPTLPLVLKNISMETRSFEKIGLVGRTGAGKSTLSLAFFRIIPFASGSIIIDDIDISKIGLNDLRKNLTIIPQDPVLFEGTLRWNLDPTETQAEADLYAALRNVGFTETLAIERFSLDMPVVEGGSNFSQGQRQLLCLARALVFKTSFLILDEATASVDTESDVKVQEAIRSAFKYTTILCIAHRLRTVIDYDRILVLDDGCVVEFDKPSLLIQKENGYLRKMCEESGEFEELMEIASSR